MVVTCNLFGGLGNNLFQISNLISYSIKYSIPYYVPKKVTNPHYKDQQVFFSKYFTYEEDGYTGIKCFYNENGFEYKEIPKQNCPYYVLNGYFQSSRYIDPYKDEVLKLLNIPYEFKKDWCAIHVRRGDYLNKLAYHPVVSSIYLQEAQQKILDNGIGKFEVYSDDISWCKNNMPQFDHADYFFSEGKSEVEDLAAASSCEHIIGSNSSFSWWAYYLNQNENKIGVFPNKNKWFGKMINHCVDDLYMPEWTLV